VYRSGLTLEEAKTALAGQAANEEPDADGAAQVRAFRDFLEVASRGIVR
jgi:UDP-N-acetylglucosamine acyltransferase